MRDSVHATTTDEHDARPRRRHRQPATRTVSVAPRFTRARVETLAFSGTTATLVLMPFFYGGNRDWVWGSFLAIVSLISVAIIWSVPVIQRFASVGIHRRRPWLLIALAAWLLLNLLHCTSLGSISLGAAHDFSSDRAASIRAFLKTSLYLQLMLQVLLLAQTHARLKRLLNVLFFSAVAHATVASVAKLWGIHIVTEFFVFGVGGGIGAFVNENSFAGYLELHLAIGAGLLVSGLKFHGANAQSWRQILRDWVALLLARKTQVRICMVLLVIALVLTGSRMGNVAFFVALLGSGALAYFFMALRPPALGALLISLVLVDLVVVGSWFGAEQIAARLAATRLELGAELQTDIQTDSAAVSTIQRADAGVPIQYFELDRERPGLSRVALKLFAQAPIFGNGAGSFRSLFPPMRTADLSAKFYDHAHNDYAQILAEYGLVGAAIILLQLVLAYKSAFAALRKRTDKLASGLAFSCIFGLSALLLHGIADFNFQIPANAATFSVMLVFGWLSHYGLRDVGRQ